MTPHIWAIDTPWAKKWMEYRGNKIIISYLTSPTTCKTYDLDENYFLALGWIKPVEEKKLTEEEILHAITYEHLETGKFGSGVGSYVELRIDKRKLAKFLAEHLK